MSMNISEIASQTGLSAKSIRMYEDKKIISTPLRSDNGYRIYNEKQVTQLGIIAKARRAGFSLDECKALVELADNPCRESAEVKEKAKKKLEEVNKKIADLQAIKQTLDEWVKLCPGDSNSKCPIIDSLTRK